MNYEERRMRLPAVAAAASKPDCNSAFYLSSMQTLPPGLKNLGNTCYLSATLQVIMKMPLVWRSGPFVTSNYAL